MAANACVWESDGSPFLVPGERVVGVMSAGFAVTSGSGYPGQTCSYQDPDCVVFITNVRVVIRPQRPTPLFSSFVMPMWLITDEKVVEPRVGRVRVEGRVVPIPGLGLPARAPFKIQFANRPLADEFMQVFDLAIESARRCQVVDGPESAAHHSVCVGPQGGGVPLDYVRLGPDHVLMDPNDPSTIILPPASTADISVSVSDTDPDSAVGLGAPDRRGYQRLL